jgi:hypothetical protein
MKLNKKHKRSLAGFVGRTMFLKVLIWGAVVAVLMSVVGWLGTDIWLASTQWLLMAAVLTLFGIYLKLS